MRLVDEQRAFVRVCLELEPPDDALRALGALPERWMIYRHMVRTRLQKMIRAGLPRTAACLGDDAFEATVDRWFAEKPPRTRFIRDTVVEFAEFALATDSPWATELAQRPWLLELCQYERTRWQLGYIEAPHRDAEDFDFARVPVLNPALRLLDLTYAVHERREAYEARPIHLCVYRRPDNDKVASRVLNGMAAALVRAWQAGDGTVTDTVQRVAKNRETTIDEAFIEGLGSMLADFIQNGIVLGSEPPSATAR